MIRILEKICKTEKWGCCKYTGEMSHESRARTIDEFGSDRDKKILLASLKCGGLGLNLTMASRVICLGERISMFHEGAEMRTDVQGRPVVECGGGAAGLLSSFQDCKLGNRSIIGGG
jgi:hypothetical protein